MNLAKFYRPFDIVAPKNSPKNHSDGILILFMFAKLILALQLVVYIVVWLLTCGSTTKMDVAAAPKKYTVPFFRSPFTHLLNTYA